MSPEQGQALLGALMLLALCLLPLLVPKRYRVSRNPAPKDRVQRVAPRVAKPKTGPAWEQDEVWIECFEEDDL